MEIIKGIEIVDLFLYVKGSLIIGDLHMGYEESLNKQGVLIPKFQFKEIKRRLEKVLGAKKPDKVIIVGDLKHEFGNISKEEWKDTLEIIDLLKKSSRLVIIKGNHDTLLEHIVKKRGLELRESYVLDDVYFCHGHKIPGDLEKSKAKVIVIGHVHPAIGLNDGVRSEIYKCFLKGKYKRKNLVVLPSVSSMPEGSDVLKENLNTPFIMKIGDFEAYVIGEKTLNFGKLKNIKRKLS